MGSSLAKADLALQHLYLPELYAGLGTPAAIGTARWCADRKRILYGRRTYAAMFDTRLDPSRFTTPRQDRKAAERWLRDRDLRNRERQFRFEVSKLESKYGVAARIDYVDDGDDF